MEQQPAIRHISGSEKEVMYKEIVEYSFETTVIHSHQKVLYINQSGADFIKGTKDEIIGLDILDLFPSEYKEFIRERIRKATVDRQIGELIETEIFKLDGSKVEVELYCHPVIFGEVPAIQSILRDITPRRNAEQKLKKVINEIGMPIVPVFDGIAVMPLVGMIDEDRISHVMDDIPKKIQQQKLEHLIIDVSGIYNIDEVVAEFLYKMNAIVELLGVTLTFTGFRPELALKTVETGLDLGKFKTMASVQHALSKLTNYC